VSCGSRTRNTSLLQKSQFSSSSARCMGLLAMRRMGRCFSGLRSEPGWLVPFHANSPAGRGKSQGGLSCSGGTNPHRGRRAASDSRQRSGLEIHRHHGPGLPAPDNANEQGLCPTASVASDRRVNLHWETRHPTWQPPGYLGSFAPRTSMRSIAGGLENSSAAFAMSALAMGPFR
jgi:hypothetical protein